ncbi:hypothetical protein FIBSPDRAFT_902008 [Athelia psychrophila]|uniref:Uncharacterized protein n=1 Tax=Athelia psychrophila TaxID=1759441 RepID=A0A167XRC9_9AGAM|nr:hypothetical protein FIBSPDRAFT_902008 [Fibularhizoctonia sp. CBS 109695]
MTSLQESIDKSAYTIMIINLTLHFPSTSPPLAPSSSASLTASAASGPSVSASGALCSVIELGRGFNCTTSHPAYYSRAMRWATSSPPPSSSASFPSRARTPLLDRRRISMFAACLPESEVFQKANEIERRRWSTTGKKTKVFVKETGRTLKKTKVFVKETGRTLKKHWVLCIYTVLLTIDDWTSTRSTSDRSNKGLSSHDATVATIIGNVATIAGYVAWRVIPIQLAEMSPPRFRATFPGVAYQRERADRGDGRGQPQDHAAQDRSVDRKADGGAGLRGGEGHPVGVVVAFVIFITLIGPENHASHFEQAKAAFEEGGGNDELEEEDWAPAGRAEGKPMGGNVEKGSVDDEKQEDERISNA